MALSEPDIKRVLIADDEINIRRVLEAILRRDGYEVVTAANGDEALARMSRDINTVITDLKMPGLDGMGLLKRLSVDFPDVPVVMITAHGSVESAVEAVKLGAFDYVEKPFDQEQIRQIVTKALRTHMLSRRNARPEDTSPRGRFRLVGESVAIRPRCSSPASRARARNWSRAPCTTIPRARAAPSSRSIAPRFPRP